MTQSQPITQQPKSPVRQLLSQPQRRPHQHHQYQELQEEMRRIRKIHQEENQEGARQHELLMAKMRKMEQEKMELQEIKEQLEARLQEKDEEIRILKSTDKEDDKIHANAIKEAILKESKNIEPVEKESGELIEKLLAKIEEGADLFNWTDGTKNCVLRHKITPEMVKDIQWDVNNTWEKTKSDARHYLGYRWENLYTKIQMFKPMTNETPIRAFKRLRSILRNPVMNFEENYRPKDKESQIKEYMKRIFGKHLTWFILSWESQGKPLDLGILGDIVDNAQKYDTDRYEEHELEEEIEKDVAGSAILADKLRQLIKDGSRMTEIERNMLEQMDVEMLQEEYKARLQEEYEERKFEGQREKLVAELVAAHAVVADQFKQLTKDSKIMTQMEDEISEQTDKEILQQEYNDSQQRKRHIEERNIINRPTKRIRRRIRPPKTLSEAPSPCWNCKQIKAPYHWNTECPEHYGI